MRRDDENVNQITYKAIQVVPGFRQQVYLGFRYKGLAVQNPHDEAIAMTQTIWQCDQVRAGQLYNRMMFHTQEEAMEFVLRMRSMEPDQVFSVEAVDARRVWN